MAQTKAGAKKVKEKYGKDAHSRFGKMGGNPQLKIATMLEAVEKIK